MHKIKVLHTDNSVDYTGGFKALLDYLVNEQASIESVVVLPKGSKCMELLKANDIACYEIPFVEIQKNLWSLLLYFPRLFLNAWEIRKIASREKIDVLHSNDLYNLTLYLVKYIYWYKAPLVTHLRLMPSAYPAFIYNALKWLHLHLSDELIAVSHAVKKSYNDLPRIHVVYDIVETEEQHSPYVSRVYFNEERPFRFLYLANFTRGKGQELAIEAFKNIVSANPATTLTFAGGLLGKAKNLTFKNELIEATKQYQLANSILFEDFVQDTELKMKQYDCLLNFSFSESFSFTSYDALRLGVPLIVSDCGGPSELFINGESGILVKNKSIESMTLAMTRIRNDQELRIRFSIMSKEHIRKIRANALGFDYLSNLFWSLKGGA